MLPKLNIGRYGHSSVIIGYKVYIVCGNGGKDDNDFYLDSIEMLDLTQVGLGWFFFNHLPGLTPRSLPTVCALSSSHILVVGGYDDNLLSDAIIVDVEQQTAQVTTSNTFHQVIQSPGLMFTPKSAVMLAWDARDQSVTKLQPYLFNSSDWAFSLFD